MSSGTGTFEQGNVQGGPSQSSFKSSPYDDSSWEVVGEPPRPEEFYPMQVPQLQTSASMVDPMFADFGGRGSSTDTERWHLPQHLAHEGHTGGKKAEEDPSLIKMTAEELESIKQEAFEAGRLQGIEAVVGTQSEKLQRIEASVTAAINDLRVQIEEIAVSVAKRGSELAVAIGKKIVDGAVEINPEYIVKIIEEALRLSGGATIRKVRVSKQDMEFIEVIGVSKMLKEFDGSWVFEADETVRAGCVVETSAGEVDYNLDNAWDRVRDNVIKVVR
jgi:flagellar biosynthesis/type III secretory pathway protein FliH